MKKLLVILLVVAMLVGIPACGAKPAESADKAKGKVVYFINAGPDDYYAQFGNAFKAIGETVGLEVKELNSDYNPEQELANVQPAG